VGRRLTQASTILGEKKGSVIYFASKVIASSYTRELPGGFPIPWNDDILVHFESNLYILEVFIGIAYESGLDFELFSGYKKEKIPKEYIDKIKRLYGKDFERGEDSEKN
jgi:hypothetical protein